MPTMNIVQAVNDALRLEMRRDPRVVVLGEDVGKFGGVFRVTPGAAGRVRRRPRHRHAARRGRHHRHRDRHGALRPRPVPEIQFADFIFPAYRPDRERAGQVPLPLRRRSTPAPMVIRTPVGGGIRGGHYHSQSPEAHFIHTAGPQGGRARRTRTTPRACSLAAIRDPDPVLFFEPKRIYRAAKGEVPEGDYVVPLGKASGRPRGHATSPSSPGAPCCTRPTRRRRRPRPQGIDVRGHRPAHALAARHRRHRGVGAEDRPRGRRPRGAEDLRLRRRDRRAHPGALLPPPRGAAGARHRLRHAVPVHARERVPAARAAHPPGASARSSRSSRPERRHGLPSSSCPTSAKGVIEAEIVKWLVKPGDVVVEDQPLVEVMTDKATVTIPSPKRGRVTRLLWKEGEIAKVHHAARRAGARGGRPSAGPGRRRSAPPAAGAVPPRPGRLRAGPGRDGGATGKALATPAVRALARELGRGHPAGRRAPGPAGRVTKEDVRGERGRARAGRARRRRRPSPVGRRRGRSRCAACAGASPRRWRMSKRTAAHFTFVEQVDATELVALKERMAAGRRGRGGEGHLPALRGQGGRGRAPQVPAAQRLLRRGARARSTGSTGTTWASPRPPSRGSSCRWSGGADQRSILDLAREIARPRRGRRAGKLRPEDVGNSTFTVTSLGALGGLFATPVINFPEVAILGVHRIRPTPVVRDGQVVVRDVMYVSLTSDHRVVDGHRGGRLHLRGDPSPRGPGPALPAHGVAGDRHPLPPRLRRLRRGP